MLDWDRLKRATKTTKAVTWLLFWYWPVCVLGWSMLAVLSATAYWWTGSLLKTALAAYVAVKIIGMTVFTATYWWSSQKPP